MYEVWRFVLCCDWVGWKVYGEFWWDCVGVYWKNGWGIGWNWFCIWGVMVMMYFYDNIRVGVIIFVYFVIKWGWVFFGFFVIWNLLKV